MQDHLARKGELVGLGGLEPPRPYGQQIFLPATVFTAAHSKERLWSGLSLHHNMRLRCCPSSLYTFLSFPKGLARDRHLKGFPEFEQFYSPRFQEGTQFI